MEQRRDRVMELKLAGVGNRVIAADVGVTVRTVVSDFNTRMRDHAKNHPETAENRALEVERLDRWTLVHWRKALDGEVHSMQLLLQISDRRTRILGLEAPKEVRHMGKVEITNDAVSREPPPIVGPGDKGWKPAPEPGAGVPEAAEPVLSD